MGSSSIWPAEILTPAHMLISPLTQRAVRSAREWLEAQDAVLKNNRQRLPLLQWPGPWRSNQVMRPYINCGRWLVRCACGDCPFAHPAWQLAVCLGCGAIYEQLRFPDDMDEIVRVLCHRPHPHQRNWAPPETLDSLIAENVAHGDPI